MVLKTLLFSVVLSTVLFSTEAYSEDKIDAQSILAIAKITGACGIMDEMVNFQKTTKLPGGDDFVARFWQAEAARRGMSIEEVVRQCNDDISLYDKLWKSMEKPKK